MALSWLHGPRARAEEPIHWLASACPICIFFLPFRRLAGPSEEEDTERKLLSTLARFRSFVTSPSSHLSPKSHAFFNPQTGIWIYRCHTTRKGLCRRRRTARPDRCLLLVNADELPQIPVTVVAHVGYARYDWVWSFLHNCRRTWRSMA